MPDPRPRLLFYCQHSLGIGHLMRSFALCEALARSFAVRLLCGGRIPEGIAPPPGFEIVALPAIAANLDFSLVGEDGGRPVADTMDERARLILQAYEELRPAAVVVELFPFGRKKFGRELLPLLAAARREPRPVVACSLRDLLVGRHDQASHDERASRLANEYFDAVLVHADPRLVRLEETFQPATPLRVPIFYTGYVVRGGDRTARPGPEAGPRGVLVSVGSGTQGEALLRAAAAAQPEVLATTGMPMRIVAGPHVREDLWAWLLGALGGRQGAELVRVVPDLGPELAAAAVSVSHCGYNTALEVLGSGIPALVVPALEEGDQETARAGRLSGLGLVRVLPRDRLTPASLAEEIRGLREFRPAPFDLDVDGAAASTAILERLVGSGTGSRGA